MKKAKGTFLSILVMVAALFFTSCERSPEKTVKNFTKHWYKGELEEARKFVTPDSQSIIDNILLVKSKDELSLLNQTTVELISCNCQPVTDHVLTCKSELYINDEASILKHTLEKINKHWFINIIN